MKWTSKVALAGVVGALASAVLLGVVPHLPIARSAGCSVSTLGGVYGRVGDGTALGTPGGLWVGVGRDTFDGAGHHTQDVTRSLDGKVSYFANLPGTYTVNTNCTGTIEHANPAGPVREAIVIVDDGREIFWMVTAHPCCPSGVTWHGIMKKL